MKKKVTYPGILGKYREYGTVNHPEFPYLDDSLNSSVLRVLLASRHKNKAKDLDTRLLYLLLDHYGIEYDHSSKWLCLSIALAKDHVPGFITEKGPKGAPVKWDIFAQYKLVEDVQDLLDKHPRLNAKSACEKLVKQKRYSQINLYTHDRV